MLDLDPSVGKLHIMLFAALPAAHAHSSSRGQLRELA